MAEGPTLEAQRQAAQLAFAAGDADLVVGDAAGLPWTIGTLATLHGDEPFVVQRFDGGLTARVFRLRDAEGRDWTLKQARPEARVRNVDGRTSFLNEVQRRADFDALKRRDGSERWRAIADTRFASYRAGVMLSPWIDGEPARGWDERQLGQVLAIACALWTEGFFEWDLCPGNVLDDGRALRLFDFGYCYRFDPLRHFSSAGRGDDVPLFHPAERFETRNFCAHLLALEQGAGFEAALAAFRVEKAIALDAYGRMRAAAAARGANAAVLDWIDGIAARWAQALRGDAAALYLAENWRSHVLDLDDDLRGRSCTPSTLARADWLLGALRDRFDELRALDAFFWADAGLDRDALLAQYAGRRREAERWQIGAPAIPN